MHKGQEVVETVGGALIKAEVGRGWQCSNGKALVAYPRLIILPISKSINNSPAEDVIYIEGINAFSEKYLANNNLDLIDKYNVSWIWSPFVSHKIYPLDLLPNYGRYILGLAPDRDFNLRGWVLKPLFWAVRGTQHPVFKYPFVFNCSFEKPPNLTRSNNSKSVDVGFILEALVWKEGVLGTCSGVVFDSKKGLVTATLLLRPSQAEYIDGISHAVSEYLSTILVE